VLRPDRLCTQEADRKSLPSQPSPQWRPEVVRSEEGAALSSAETGPGMGSYSLAGGSPGQTPDAPSASATQRSQPPALPSPPPVCPFPFGRNRMKETGTEGQGNERQVGEMGRGRKKREKRSVTPNQYLTLCGGGCIHSSPAVG